ncbi:LAETG motif-containing sortase-dependent surface protein [Streptomyces sp. NPDC016845]|uniref:LAETG motif-containing sortase-dependent surface protein n=1 Tax=Streptomyces sp. NPDC016845 TaxID=3364972 RepID=UPI0037AB03CB
MSVTPRISARAARFAGVAAAATALTLGVAGTASACNISEFSAKASCVGDKGVITVTDVDASGTPATVTLFDAAGKDLGSQVVKGTREGATITFEQNWAPNTQYRVHVKTDKYDVDDDIKGGVTTPGTACATEKPTPPVTEKPTPPVTEKPTPAPETSTPVESATPAPSAPETESAAAPAPDNSASPAGGSDLAETGASSNTGLFAGIAAALVVAGGGVVFALRKRGAAQN